MSLKKYWETVIIMQGNFQLAFISDHCGGNHYFQNKYPNLQIYATAFEAPFIENPFLEPFYLGNGAFPFKELRTKMLEAKPSTVTQVITFADHLLTIHGINFQIYTLPGHSLGMIGVKSPDGVLYCADTVFGEETVDKHGLLFYTNIVTSLTSIEKLRNVQTNSYVLYHGGEYTDLTALLDKHVDVINQTSQRIYNLIQEFTPSLEDLIQKVMEAFEIGNNVFQYALTTAVVRSYITKLQQEGRVSVMVTQGRLKLTPSSA